MKNLILISFLLLFSLPLSAQVVCQWNNAQKVSFPEYSGTVDQTASGQIQFQCSQTAQFTVGLNQGGTAGATINNRMLYCTGCTPATLGYQLYSNAGYSVIWGNSAGSWMSSGSIPANDYTCSNGTCYYNMYVYAQIPAMEYAQANTPNYDDTVGITILCSNCTQGASSFSESLYLNLQDTLTSCGVNAASLVFPNYSGSMVTGTSTITVQCGSAGGTTQFTVGLDGGQNGGSVTNPRNLVLAGGTQKLQYNLCTNSGTGCTAWGNSSGGTQQTGTENGSVIPFTVYGQIPASSGNATNKTALQHPGSYSDTITVSLTY